MLQCSIDDCESTWESTIFHSFRNEIVSCSHRTVAESTPEPASSFDPFFRPSSARTLGQFSYVHGVGSTGYAGVSSLLKSIGTAPSVAGKL